MENTVGRYEHLNGGEEVKHGYLFLHPAFSPAGPITMSFGFQSCSTVAPKGTPVASVRAASRSSCLCFLRVHHDVPHVGHQPIGSACSLCANCQLRTPGLFFFFSRTRWISRSPERGIPFKRAACCQGLRKCKGSVVLSVGDRRQEGNYNGVIFIAQGNKPSPREDVSVFYVFTALCDRGVLLPTSHGLRSQST